MTTYRSEEIFVGVVSAGIVLYVGWKIVGALRNGRMRSRGDHITASQPVRFGLLLGFHAIVFLLATVIAADLLFNLGIRNSL